MTQALRLLFINHTHMHILKINFIRLANTHEYLLYYFQCYSRLVLAMCARITEYFPLITTKTNHFLPLKY